MGHNLWIFKAISSRTEFPRPLEQKSEISLRKYFNHLVMGQKLWIFQTMFSRTIWQKNRELNFLTKIHGFFLEIFPRTSWAKIGNFFKKILLRIFWKNILIFQGPPEEHPDKRKNRGIFREIYSRPHNKNSWKEILSRTSGTS